MLFKFAVYIVLMLFFPASASPVGSGEPPRDALPGRAEGEAETVPGAAPGHQ